MELGARSEDKGAVLVQCHRCSGLNMLICYQTLGENACLNKRPGSSVSFSPLMSHNVFT